MDLEKASAAEKRKEFLMHIYDEGDGFLCTLSLHKTTERPEQNFFKKIDEVELNTQSKINMFPHTTLE